MTNQAYVSDSLPFVEEPSKVVFINCERNDIADDKTPAHDGRDLQVGNTSTSDDQKMADNHTKMKKGHKLKVNVCRPPVSQTEDTLIIKKAMPNDDNYQANSNADQQPEGVDESNSIAQSESVPQRIQQAKEAKERARHIQDTKIFTYLVSVFAVFLLFTSVLGLTLPQYIVIMLCWTLIPVFFTLVALIYKFLYPNQFPSVWTRRRNSLDHH